MMARKVGKIKKLEQVKHKCTCGKDLNYVMVMPRKKMRLRCSCGKVFNRNMEEVKQNV